MASAQDNLATSGLTGLSQTILEGQGNYISWRRDLKINAEGKDVVQLIAGQEEIKQPPVRPSKPNIEKLRKELGVPTDTAHLQAQNDALKEAHNNYSYSVTDYKLDLDEYEKQQKRVRDANSLLRASVNPAIRGCLTMENPRDIYEEIKVLCKMSDSQALTLLHQKIDNLHFNSSSSISDFFNRLIVLQQDVNQLKGTYGNDQLMSKIVNSLTKDYDDFVRYWNMLAGSDALPRDVTTLHARLLGEEARLLSQGKGKPVKNSSGNSSSSGNSKKDTKKDNKDDSEKEKHHCKHCKKMVLHKEKNCWENPDNKKSENPNRKSTNMVDGKHDNVDEPEGSTTSSKATSQKTRKRVVAVITGDRRSFEAKLDATKSPNTLKIDVADAFEKVPIDNMPLLCGNCYRKGHSAADCNHITNTNIHEPRHVQGQPSLHDKSHHHNPNTIDTRTYAQVASGMPHPTSPSLFSFTDPKPQMHSTSALSAKEVKEIKGLEENGEAQDIDTHASVRISPQTMMLIEENDVPNNTWIMDSGANQCIANDKSWFTTFTPTSFNFGTASDDDGLKVEGGGTVELLLHLPNEEPTVFTVTKVAYAPTARCNILSMSCLNERAGINGKWGTSITLLDRDGDLIGQCTMFNGLYHLQLSNDTALVLTNPSHTHTDKECNSDSDSTNIVLRTNQDEENTADLDNVLTLPPGVRPPSVVALIDFTHPVWKWHRRLGHIGLDNMIKLLKMSEGMDITEKQIKAHLEVLCPVCATTKAVNRVPKDPATRRHKEMGRMMHADLYIYPKSAWDGTKYVLAMTDDAKRFTWTSRLTNKFEIPVAFKNLHNEIQTSEKCTIGTYRLDNEFPSYGELAKWFKDQGIAIEPSVPHTHHMNGTAERAFRTERDKAASMLQDANISGRILKILDARTAEILRQTSIPETLWIEAWDHSNWLKNRAPTRALKNKMTPWEAKSGYKPNLSVEKIFGSRVYVTIPPGKRVRKSLMDPRGWLGYFVGHETEAVMRVWNPDTGKVQRVTAARVNDSQSQPDCVSAAQTSSINVQFKQLFHIAQLS